MHADHGETDIEAAVGFDFFHCHGVLEMVERISGKGSAGVEPGDYGHFLVAEVLRRFSFYDEGAVQMFTALEGEAQFFFLRRFQQRFHYRRAHFVGAVFPDVAAADFAGRAPDDDEAAFAELRHFTKLIKSLLCFFS